MARKKKAQQDDPCELLALLLRDALISAWIEHNPTHGSPAFDAVRHLGDAGFHLVAANLIRLGVIPPACMPARKVKWLETDDERAAREAAEKEREERWDAIRKEKTE